MVTCYFGLPGCGKTTFLARIAQKELRRIRKGISRYERVLTNFYCDGCFRIDYSDLGKYDVENSLILLDELTLFADSRSFKLFDEAKKYFFLMHRHYNCDIIYFTQQWDGIDKKIRDITSDLYYLKKCFSNQSALFLRPLQQFTVARRVYRTLEINEYTKEIINGYRFPTFWERVFGGRTKIICYRPSWYKYFDSWEKSKKLKPFVIIPW